ncbi:MAG TPA: hypothetical protein O0X72_05140 [Methanocorpusculum sp.]|nr:hypothetical protein [Methanocorpusculum sp.]
MERIYDELSCEVVFACEHYIYPLPCRGIIHMVVEHICGFKREIYCRECGTELIQNSHGQLLCPKCGRRPAILCPNCGRLW